MLQNSASNKTRILAAFQLYCDAAALMSEPAGQIMEIAMRKKRDLPQKICVTCGLPFSWRRKWSRDWDNVKYCSRRCRGGGNAIAS